MLALIGLVVAAFAAALWLIFNTDFPIYDPRDTRHWTGKNRP